MNDIIVGLMRCEGPVIFFTVHRVLNTPHTLTPAIPTAVYLSIICTITHEKTEFGPQVHGSRSQLPNMYESTLMLTCMIQLSLPTFTTNDNLVIKL